MKALLLCNYERFGAATINEHINAIIDHSSFEIFAYNDLVKNSGDLKLAVDIDNFDVIIVHYSIFLAVNAYCSTRTKAILKKFRGVKVAFLQDEYRFVDRSINAMHEAGIDIVFSCVPEHSIELVYPREQMGDIRVVNTLTGYVSEFLTQLKPRELRKRRYDVSYRGRRYPDWHGSMGREKYEIAEKFLKHARKFRLKTNISCREKDRLYGARWVNLIQNSRAVLGVESGASVFDFKGLISAKTETVRNLLGRKGISYDTLREQYFLDQENNIDLAQISPRVFEAMCLRSLCILYEGNYSGVLEPNVHYLPLKKDFSNFAEIVSKLKDNIFVSEMIANAYADVVMNDEYSYFTFVKRMDREIMDVLKVKVLAVQQDKNSRPGSKTKLFRYEHDQNFREEFLRAHPCIKTHGSLVASSVNLVKDWLPHSVRSTLKSIVK